MYIYDRKLSDSQSPSYIWENEGLGKLPAGNKWLKLFPDAKRSKADFIIDGESYFESVIWAIETAKTRYDYIYITGWMLDIDFQLVKSDKSKTLFKLLKDRAERGVEIRILIWDNLVPGYAKLHNDAIPRLNQLPNTKAYIDEHTFFPQASKQLIQNIAPYISDAIKKYGHLLLNPAAKLEENYDVPGSYVLYRLLTLMNQRTVGAHHEKLVIVKGDEGLIAFCGGIDFNKNRVISTVDWPEAGLFKSKSVKKEFRFPYYHDNACRLRGPAAYDVLQKFKKRWNNHPVANKVRLIGSNEAKPKEAVAPYPYTKVVGTYNSPDGRQKDRSLQEAYLKIIENAESYIYIEDQYLVNLDVARVLNKKIKEPKFQKLTFAIQDSIETADIFIPNRKRGEFLDAVLRDTNNVEKEKVLMAVIDRTKWDQEFYHPGMHAKTLIVDDEIAIIGSANVNRRSFTCDSETSVIVFDDAKKVDRNFARIFRIITWKSFLRKPVDKILYESWWNYPTTISRGDKAFSILIKYTQDEQPDLDVKISDFIKKTGVLGPVAAYRLLGKNLTATSAALSPYAVRSIFDTLWEHFVDPVCR
jgi:phosphatidylserine/phosphatidylglycerophosphate/cardiolipin synthase-like enzyme